MARTSRPDYSARSPSALVMACVDGCRIPLATLKRADQTGLVVRILVEDVVLPVAR